MPLYNVCTLKCRLIRSTGRFADDIAQVTLKENASPEELNKAKEKAKIDGGVIKHEFTLIKGFTSVEANPLRLISADGGDCSVEFPADQVGILETNEHIHVEEDAEVKTQ